MEIRVYASIAALSLFSFLLVVGACPGWSTRIKRLALDMRMQIRPLRSGKPLLPY